MSQHLVKKSIRGREQLFCPEHIYILKLKKENETFIYSLKNYHRYLPCTI
jgi:hypothetical protein